MATAKPAREAGPIVDPELSSSSGPAVNAPVPRPDGGAAPAAPPPRLLQRPREAIRVRHYSIRTEAAYVDWARRFILFHGKHHPSALGAGEVAAFLTHLAVDRAVAPSTQIRPRRRSCSSTARCSARSYPGSTRWSPRATRAACRWC
jgi:hypothetical protein